MTDHNAVENPIFAPPETIEPDHSPETLSTKSQRGDRQVQFLQRVLENHEGDRVVVLLQDFPDPDILSCAWAFRTRQCADAIHALHDLGR